MNKNQQSQPVTAQLDKSSYTIESLEDEIRVDQLCTVLLKSFHRSLLDGQQLDPLEAGSLAAGADYFLRDFIIDNRRLNIFDVKADSVRAFAGHWYISSNLEPNLTELTAMLKGVESFYHDCAAKKLIDENTAEEISVACNDFGYYSTRIENFLDLTGDGFVAWEKECPLN